jgi:hypothetical protein
MYDSARTALLVGSTKNLAIASGNLNGHFSKNIAPYLPEVYYLE